MTKDELGKVLDRLAVNCSRKWTSDKERELSIDNFYMGVGDLTKNQIMEGFKKVVRTPNPFIPDAGSFRTLCVSGEGSKSLEDDANQAWALALKIVQKRGGDYSPIFKDSVIAEAIRKMGGWKQLCKMLIEEETWKKKEFIEYYLVARRQDKEFLPLLRGAYKNYVFVGYDKTDNLEKLVKAIESREGEDKQILQRIYKGVDERKTAGLIN